MNTSDTNPHSRLNDEFKRYLMFYPGEASEVELFQAFIQSSTDIFERSHPPGHFTGSSWLVSKDGQRVLLTHHKKLGRWLQLGGHADGDNDLARVSLREAEEESGLTALTVEPEIFDLERHAIPARGNDAEHFHYDVRFVVHATGSEDYVVSDESHALAWRVIKELVDDAEAEESIRRMARKWCRRDFSPDRPASVLGLKPLLQTST